MMVSKKTEAPKAEKLTFVTAANRVVAECRGRTTASELAALADEMVVAGGGTSNMRTALHRVKQSLATAESLGAVVLTRPTDVMVERTKP